MMGQKETQEEIERFKFMRGQKIDKNIEKGG